jgi:hypothetical protein
MAADFPAAHSMDTDWFAVDKCGHVALFSTGEAGAMPLGAKILIGPEGGDDQLSEKLFGPLTEEMEDDDDLEYPDAAKAGIFRYQHETDNWISGPYERSQTPEKPAFLQRLPPEVGKKLTGFRFDDLCFLDHPHIQPVEHAPCESWEPAWLSLDGKTARPMPGREDEYRKHLEERMKEGVQDGVTWTSPDPEKGASGLIGWLKRLFGGKG